MKRRMVINCQLHVKEEDRVKVMRKLNVDFKLAQW